MSGYNRYLKFYLEANYPMIIYWDPLKQSASQNITIPDYMSETYFAGIQKIRTFTTYPVSPPYGGIIYKNNLNEVLANLEGLGWSNLREWTWKRTTEEDWSANRCTGGTVTAEDENLPNEGAAKAFDANYETKWIAPANQTPWIAYQFAASATYIIQRYRITAGNDFLDRDIKSWQFQGSNNGSDWDTLHTVTNEFFGPRYEQRDYYFKNNTAYEYYRINVTANWGSGDCQLMEIEMYEFEG